MPDDNLSKVGQYLGLAMLLPISTAVGYGIGYGLDRLFHTHFLAIVFLIIGVVAGFVRLIRELQQDTDSDGH